MQTLESQINHLDGEIADTVNAQKNSPQAIEVRAYWRGPRRCFRLLFVEFLRVCAACLLAFTRNPPIELRSGARGYFLPSRFSIALRAGSGRPSNIDATCFG